MSVIESQQHPQQTRQCATLWAGHVDDGDVWTLELSGEADIATLPMLREELAEGLRVNRARFVIDMAGLRFCDVGSAELIMSVSRSSSVSLSGVAGMVKRVFDLLDPEWLPTRDVSVAPVDPPPRLDSSPAEDRAGPSQ